MLDDMSTVVTRLQAMSIEMGSELEMQNQCVVESRTFFAHLHLCQSHIGVFALYVRVLLLFFSRMIRDVSSHVDETQQKIDELTSKIDKMLSNMGASVVSSASTRRDLVCVSCMSIYIYPC